MQVLCVAYYQTCPGPLAPLLKALLAVSSIVAVIKSNMPCAKGCSNCGNHSDLCSPLTDVSADSGIEVHQMQPNVPHELTVT